MVKSKVIWDGKDVATAIKGIKPYFCCTSSDYQQNSLKLYKQKGPFKERGGILLFMWLSKLKKKLKKINQKFIQRKTSIAFYKCFHNVSPVFHIAYWLIVASFKCPHPISAPGRLQKLDKCELLFSARI